MNKMYVTIAGISAGGEISEKVLQAAASASAVVLQADISDTLREKQISYTTLDSLFENAENFDDLIDKSTAVLIRDELIFIAIGDVYHNQIAISVVKQILKSGGSIRIIPGGDPALCAAFQNGIIDKIQGVCIYTASSFDMVSNTNNVLVIHEIDTRLIASELKLKLSKFYDDEHPVFLADMRSNTGKKIPLYLLDGEQSYGYYTSIVLPSKELKQKERYTFSDLITIMDRLRSTNGCPWDNKQTHQSLKRYLLEESYEVLEAIDHGDTDALYDELGDVLLQVVFHAKIAQQQGAFDYSDITTAVCKKMITRHPHIFGTAVADKPEEVIKNWEQIKKHEKGQETQTEVLKNVPKSMPALMRSEKVQHKAAHIGFDFRDISEAIEKTREEIAEIEQDIHNSNKLSEECGDLLFSAVNIARLAGIEPEIALQKATDKFIERFEHVEQIANAQEVDMHTCDVDQLNNIWDEAKSKQNNNDI